MSTARPPASVVALREADAARCGSKAASLAELARDGLPLAQGVCLPFDTYRRARALAGGQRPPRFVADQATWRAVAALGPRVVVRSSASCEDAEGFSAAGLFESVRGVDVSVDARELQRAVETVWSSLTNEAARALLADAGRDADDEAMAVLIQRELSALRGGHALVHDDGFVEVEAVRGHPSALAAGHADPRRFGVAASEPAPEGFAELVALLRRAVPDGAAGAFELEWLVDQAGAPWLLQRRPLAHAEGVDAAAGAVAAALVELDEAQARSLGGRRWVWDREHNPEALSPAHASLIDELRSREHVRVVGGYLYYADVAEDESAGAADGELALDELRRAEWALAAMVARARAEQHEAAIRRDPGARLIAARAFFRDFAARYDETLGRARRALVRAARARSGSDVVGRFVAADHQGFARARDLARAAACDDLYERAARLCLYRARYGRMAAVWDIAEPTLGERPTHLAASVPHGCAPSSISAAVTASAGDQRDDDEDRLASQWLAAARRSREDDDVLFAEALWLLRSALLAAGQQLAAAGSLSRVADVFALTLDQTAAALSTLRCVGGRASPRLQVDAARGRARWRAARARRPALLIEADGRLEHEPHSAGAGEQLEGLGVGERATGRAYVLRGAALDAPDIDGRVLVCRALLPAAAPLLSRAAALVCETGGALSHAACLARELGVPAVVGVGAGLSAIRQGERLEVDGARGRVVRLVGWTAGGDNGDEQSKGPS